MTTEVNLIDLYRDMLREANLDSDEEGFVYQLTSDGEREPYHIHRQRLVLPTPNQLAVPDSHNRVFFHPLMENQLRGESKILTDYRSRLNERLNIKLSAITTGLMRLATSPAEHPKLTPDQTVFLSAVKDADNGVLDRMSRIMKAMPLGDPTHCFVHIYIKRGGTIKGKKHMRVGVVSFPLYEELKKKPTQPKEKNEVWGVPMRGKDRDIIMAFLKYLLPGIDEPETFYRGSDSMVAPSLEALMGVVTTLGDAINAQLELYPQIFGKSNLEIGGLWPDVFQNTEAMLKQIRAIPMQAGNEGAVPQTGSQAPKVEIPQSPIGARSQGAPTYSHTSMTAPPPAADKPAIKAPDRIGGVYEEKKATPQTGGLNHPPAPAPAPTPAPAPIPPMHVAAPHNPYGGPAFNPHTPPPNQYAQQYQQTHYAPHPGSYPYPSQNGQPLPYGGQQPQGIVRTPNGIDVNSMFMSRPDLAQRAGYVPPGFQAPMMAPNGAAVPRWAQPVYMGQPQVMQQPMYYGAPQPQPGGYGYGV